MSKWGSKVSSKGASHSDKDEKKPKKQVDFTIGSVDFMKVGTIAVFGVEEDELVRNIAEKLNRISSMYGDLVTSRMGEEVPEPESYEVQDGNEWPLQLEYREKTLLDKVFCIIYMQGVDDEGERAFAYVNVRCDRLDTLHGKMFDGPAFNLPDYSTIVLTGHGMPTDEDREKLQRDYLFGERHTNIRIFPPLAEVT